MSAWHTVRRMLAAAVAALVTLAAEHRGATFGWAIAMGVAGAIIFASLLFPLVWKPPTDGNRDAGSKGE